MNARWSSRSLGSRLQHQIFYAFIRRVGTSGAYVLLIFVVSWYVLRPSVRNRSRAYLTRRFPGCGFFSLLLHTWKLQWTFGQCLVDRAAAGILGGFSFGRWFADMFGDRVREGKGVILLAAHTGCWQMSPYALAEHAGAPVTVLAHNDHEDIDRQAHEHAGTRPPFQTVTAGGGDGPGNGVDASLTLLQSLRRGGLLCAMGDRVTSSAGQAVRVSFFGSPVMLPVAAYRLASASGAPVVCAFALRTGPRRGELRLGDVIRVPAGLGRSPGNYQYYAQRFAAALERFCQEHPYQFFTFYDLWEQ